MDKPEGRPCGLLSVGRELTVPPQGAGSPCPSCQVVGLDFFGSMVAMCREGQLSQHDARRFVTGFLEAQAKAATLRPKRGTGQCGHHGWAAPLPALDCWPQGGAPETGEDLLSMAFLTTAQGLRPALGEWESSEAGVRSQGQGQYQVLGWASSLGRESERPTKVRREVRP